nr:hypothetical protein [Tanacetum cinerariifolium]
DESRFKYEVLDQEGRGLEQGVHVFHSEAIEDKEDLPSLKPPPIERQEDSYYCRQPMDQTSGHPTTSRRLPTWDSELPDSA